MKSINNELIDEYLQGLETELFNAAPIALELNYLWLSQFPRTPAVYMLKENERMVYVGETNNLNKCLSRLVVTELPASGLGAAIKNSHGDQLALYYVRVMLGRKELADKIRNTKTYRKQSPKRNKSNHMEKMKQKYANAYKPWFPEDDRRLTDMFNNGKSVSYMAGVFQRNENAICARIEKLMLG